MESIIENCPLFTGMAQQAAALLEAKPKTYKKGAMLHRPYEQMHRFGLVLYGSVQVCADDLEGNRMIMAEVSPGGTFGESLCFLGTPNAPVYILATAATQVLWMSVVHLADDTPEAKLLYRRFTALLATRTLQMNSRIQILSKLTLRQKLMTYFSTFGTRSFTVPMSREDMATYMGTNRAALCRVLSQLQREGVLSYRKNEFRILK